MKVASPVRRGEQRASVRMLALLPYAFSGEVQISRKHTRFAERDLRHLTARAVGQLGGKLQGLDERILCYNETLVDDRRAHDIVIKALDAGAITTTQVSEVL